MWLNNFTQYVISYLFQFWSAAMLDAISKSLVEQIESCIFKNLICVILVTYVEMLNYTNKNKPTTKHSVHVVVDGGTNTNTKTRIYEGFDTIFIYSLISHWSPGTIVKNTCPSIFCNDSPKYLHNGI